MQTLRINDIHLIYLVRDAPERKRKLIETGIGITRQNPEYSESRFGMISDRFYEKYQAGETGDDTDTMRWTSEIRAFRAKLIPIKSAHLPPRKPGSARGKFKVPKEFFDPLPDEIPDAFEQ